MNPWRWPDREKVWDRSNSDPSVPLVEFDGDPLIWPELLIEEPPATDTPPDDGPPELLREPPA